MLSQELQTALDAAFMVARRQHHEMLTVEHLLVSLLDRLPCSVLKLPA